MQIYQIFTRLFGNQNMTRTPHGTMEENGVGKMNDITTTVLNRIHDMGFTHVWFTGIVRHATTTDYSNYGIPRQHPAIVKGKAGSPYAITDYYDVDPDLAVQVPKRMDEFEALVKRTHDVGMKVIIDFVPNHVARQYHSICKPQGVRDLGEKDDVNKHFDIHNNFYYCPSYSFEPAIDLCKDASEPYREYPAKCTGNDCFNASPSANDWYETVKLNYGIDYTDAGGRSEHFDPMPDTWRQMTDILLFWASKGVDGFRCDMAEMVPTTFWQYAIGKLKATYPHVIIIGEVYNPTLYRAYIASGFDYLYDKVGMYDCLRDIVCGKRPAHHITRQWQSVDDILPKMFYFLENHDEQRIASDFFCGSAERALPAFMTCAWLHTNPVMVYAGQEFGERGMDAEGFSGLDGRTTIFDYWAVKSIIEGYYQREKMDKRSQRLSEVYQKILQLCHQPAIGQGQFFDLMYANTQHSALFNPDEQYVFLRKSAEQLLLIVVNFSPNQQRVHVNIPQHAFDFLHMRQATCKAVDLLTHQEQRAEWSASVPFVAQIPGYGGRIYEIQQV
ncbi:alpha-amylase [Hoylesella timonensis]|uniref:Alpha-amylase n=1 Tax=Hoylesella timonensis TaxID=386414 RepID=A0A2K0XND2_9BACT|nr:alpha-amylase family glycosyl hydrolase [Hoylesella timonensis]PNP96032.1 alpha-amylase [Hoylesella timonensis]